METNTYKKFINAVRDNYPEYLIVHHSGGTDAQPLLDTSNHTAKIMESYHLSKGWEGLGYHYVIHKNGDVWKGRPEHYHAAHTVGYNNKSIGICLSGNFDATLPTKEQEKSLATLLSQLQLKYNIGMNRIIPHRKFANKSCYGNRLKDDWARNLIIQEEKVPITVPKSRLAQITNYLMNI